MANEKIKPTVGCKVRVSCPLHDGKKTHICTVTKVYRHGYSITVAELRNIFGGDAYISYPDFIVIKQEGASPSSKEVE